jgi:hypothetical protein
LVGRWAKASPAAGKKIKTLAILTNVVRKNMKAVAAEVLVLKARPTLLVQYHITSQLTLNARDKDDN